MGRWGAWLALLCVCSMVCCPAAPGAGAAPAQAAAPAQGAVTVSGTVTGPGGVPVPGVWLGIGSPEDWREVTTTAAGVYSISIVTSGELWFHVRPDISTRLVQANRWLDGVSGDVTQDFALVTGHLLDIQVVGSGGTPVAEPVGTEVMPLDELPPPEWWYSLDRDDVSGRYRAVLPPDVHYVTARQVPAGYYQTTRAFDLRAGDVTADLALNTGYVHPIPYEPPDAAGITIGSPDSLGEAAVAGAPGAALPLARVLLVNLRTGHQAHTVSAGDGSFAARIYAPPGSSIMVKHGPASYRWSDLKRGLAEGINPFPGTIVAVPHIHTAPAGSLPFAAAGAIDLHADDAGDTPNYVGAAWAVTGTVGPVGACGEWTRVLTGTYAGETVPGLYLGGLNWTQPALADLDADGDPDLVVGEQRGGLVLYRNAGSGMVPDWQFETEAYAGIDAGAHASPVLVDVTGDGAPDLFLGTGAGLVDIYYNRGTPAAPAWPAQPDASLPAAPSPAPALDDVTGDGKLDLVVGHEGGTLFLYHNTGTTTAPAWSYVTDSYGGVAEAGHAYPAFLDLDGDTDRDMLVGLCGNVVWYERGGPATSPSWTRHDADPIGFGGGSCGVRPAVGDWSGDGAPDLVTGEHWGGLRYFSAASGSWSEQAYPYPFELAGDTAPALADWDDDGDVDLLLGQVWGQVQQYTNGGTPVAPDWQPDGELVALPWTDHPHAFPALADWDGDGDLDLLVGEGGWQGPGAGGNIHYYQNQGTTVAPNWVFQTSDLLNYDVGGWATPTFADVDGDNDLDLYVGDEAGTITFVENVGAKWTPLWAAPVQPYAGLDLGEGSAPAFYDVDGDGDLDMLVGVASGAVACVRNVGGPGVPAWEVVAPAVPGLHVGERAIPAVADLDGDGQPELLLGDGDGGLDVYRYAGAGEPPGPGHAYQPGDTLQVEGTLRIYGHDIDAATDPAAVSIAGWVRLMMLFDAEGRSLPPENYFMSTLLTPGGFPVQGTGRAIAWPDEAAVLVDGLHYAGGHALEGHLSATVVLPSDLPPGLYRPVADLHIEGVPVTADWLAASVAFVTWAPHEAPLPPIIVAEVAAPRLVWRLLMDDVSQGARGAGARKDRGSFALASQIVSQGAAYVAPRFDTRTGQLLTYRLEPFLPAISFAERRMPAAPLLPFVLPGGWLDVTVRAPDGTVQHLGREALAQSFNRTPTTRGGLDLNEGTVQLDDVYSLQAASDRFQVAFDAYGHHVITMTGVLTDVWGNAYAGGGTYDVHVARSLDIDPGVLPGTPLAAGDTFNPTLRFHPRVPARVHLSLTLYPGSDPGRAVVHEISGYADRFGHFSPGAPPPIAEPGEYRVDLTATYTATDGTRYVGAMTWGGVVMTPDQEATLTAHGRRGLDSLEYIPSRWFVSGRDLNIPEGAVSHTLNPYENGDLLWSRLSDGPVGGDSLVMGASIADPIGLVEAAVRARFQRMGAMLYAPGTFEERVAVGELPLFLSTRSGRAPQFEVRRIGADLPADVDQVAYSYRSSQRPGVRVREVVADDSQSGGYWRLNTLYDDQAGVGVLGDQPNDFKFQYVGAVYRDVDTGQAEYLGQGSGWVFIPDDDPTGTRVMPPFAGPGNGGWTTEGGPLLTLKGEDIDIFILPTGVGPGAVLEVGETFRFAGHVMPTLDSRVAVTVTAPSGAQYQVDGRANRVGYFCDPDDDLQLAEPGLWTADVRVWHDGRCSGGATVPPYPTGDVLGSDGGRFWFYVVPRSAPRLEVSAPAPGFLTFDGEVTPITIEGTLPDGLSSAIVDYTLSMPGYLLEQGQASISGNTWHIVFDPVALHDDYPNLDLVGRDDHEPGLADTFSLGLLLRGEGAGGVPVYRANTVTIQGEEVFVGDAPSPPVVRSPIYLPLVLKGGA